MPWATMEDKSSRLYVTFCSQTGGVTGSVFFFIYTHPCTFTMPACSSLPSERKFSNLCKTQRLCVLTMWTSSYTASRSHCLIHVHLLCAFPLLNTQNPHTHTLISRSSQQPLLVLLKDKKNLYPPKAPPISAPLVGMLTFTMPQSEPLGLWEDKKFYLSLQL